MIVKVQRSIPSGTGMDTVLIYDKTRTYTEVRALSREQAQKKGGVRKSYYQAELRRGYLKLGKRIHPDNW